MTPVIIRRCLRQFVLLLLGCTVALTAPVPYFPEAEAAARSRPREPRPRPRAVKPHVEIRPTQRKPREGPRIEFRRNRNPELRRIQEGRSIQKRPQVRNERPRVVRTQKAENKRNRPNTIRGVSGKKGARNYSRLERKYLKLFPRQLPYEPRKKRAERPFNAAARGGNPSDRGFAPRTARISIIKPGTRLYRFGDPKGQYFTTQKHATRESLAAIGKDPRSTYEVLKPLPMITGRAKNAYGLRGGGVQAWSNHSAQELVNLGYLKRPE